MQDGARGPRAGPRAALPECADFVPVPLIKEGLTRAAPRDRGWMLERLARAWAGRSLLRHPEARVRRLGARVVLLSGQDRPALEGEPSWSVRALLEEARRRRADGFDCLDGWLRGSACLALEALDRLPRSELASGLSLALEHPAPRVGARAGELALEHRLELAPMLLEDPEPTVRLASYRVLAEQARVPLLGRAREGLATMTARSLVAEGWKGPGSARSAWPPCEQQATCPTTFPTCCAQDAPSLTRPWSCWSRWPPRSDSARSCAALLSTWGDPSRKSGPCDWDGAIFWTRLSHDLPPRGCASCSARLC